MNDRTYAFGVSFLSEVSRRRVAVQLLDCADENGIADTCKRVARFGERCIGCLVVGTKPADSVKDVLRALVRLSLPTVYIDREDLSRELGISSPRLSFCHFSEERFTTAAAEHLYSWGHRRVGYVSSALEPWQVERGTLLRQWAERQNPALRIVTYGEWIAGIKAMRRDELAAKLASMTRARQPHVRKTLDYFVTALRLRDRALVWPLPGPGSFHHLADLLQRMPQSLEASELKGAWESGAVVRFLPLPELASAFHNMESLLPSLLDPDVTALIIARDRNIPSARSALQRAGIDIPGDLSAISYDNDIHYAHRAISSVDPGADDLGYQAYHALEGDIPLRYPVGRGHIVARPWIADRYSVAPVSTSVRSGRSR